MEGRGPGLPWLPILPSCFISWTLDSRTQGRNDYRRLKTQAKLSVSFVDSLEASREIGSAGTSTWPQAEAREPLVNSLVFSHLELHRCRKPGRSSACTSVESLWTGSLSLRMGLPQKPTTGLPSSRHAVDTSYSVAETLRKRPLLDKTVRCTRAMSVDGFYRAATSCFGP